MSVAVGCKLATASQMNLGCLLAAVLRPNPSAVALLCPLLNGAGPYCCRATARQATVEADRVRILADIAATTGMAALNAAIKTALVQVGVEGPRAQRGYGCALRKPRGACVAQSWRSR